MEEGQGHKRDATIKLLDQSKTLIEGSLGKVDQDCHLHGSSVTHILVSKIVFISVHASVIVCITLGFYGPELFRLLKAYLDSSDSKTA